MKVAAALFLVLAMPAIAQEDDQHRADRLRTQALNSRSPNGYSTRPYEDGAVSNREAYEDARADYRRRLTDWRRRVAACEAGYYRACDR